MSESGDSQFEDSVDVPTVGDNDENQPSNRLEENNSPVFGDISLFDPFRPSDRVNRSPGGCATTPEFSFQRPGTPILLQGAEQNPTLHRINKTPRSSQRSALTPVSEEGSASPNTRAATHGSNSRAQFLSSAFPMYSFGRSNGIMNPQAHGSSNRWDVEELAPVHRPVRFAITSTRYNGGKNTDPVEYMETHVLLRETQNTAHKENGG